MSPRAHVEQQNRIVLVAGRKGTGKSTKADEILRYVTSTHSSPRVFAYDTMGEHRWIPDSFDEQDRAMIYLMESAQYPSFLARYVPDSDDGEEKDFDLFCDEVYTQGNMLFLIEEVVMLGCTAGYAPKKFRRLIRLGRHRNVDMICTTQRLEECPRLLTSQADIFILFCHTEPNAIDRISERCGVEIAQKVKALNAHEFLVYDVNQKKEVSIIDCGCMMVPITSLKFQPTEAQTQTT